MGRNSALKNHQILVFSKTSITGCFHERTDYFIGCVFDFSNFFENLRLYTRTRSLMFWEPWFWILRTDWINCQSFVPVFDNCITHSDVHEKKWIELFYLTLIKKWWEEFDDQNCWKFCKIEDCAVLGGYPVWQVRTIVFGSG